ncbi:hypothetical protein BVY01_00080 [bacterium I07]|nr:hypothetical protein BVY01_00080 [bacterium I07]
MYRPLVSIVIPVYNGSNFLNQSIQSALDQTYNNIEILVVNDGSNDDGASEAIALSYGDHIRYIAKGKNGGVSTVLNVAISHMKGDWLSWLSHDDIYKQNKIQRQIEFINELKYSAADLNRTVIYGGSETINTNGQVIRGRLKRLRYRIKKYKHQLDRILDYAPIDGCTVLIPKYSFEEVGLFNESYRCVQDREYWCRMIFKGYQFYFINEILVQSRVHDRQVGRTNAELCKYESIKINKWFSDQVWNIEAFREWKHFWRLAWSQTKRGFPDAAIASFSYAKKLMNPITYTFLYPVSRVIYSGLFHSRIVLRWLYHKLYPIRI